MKKMANKYTNKCSTLRPKQGNSNQSYTETPSTLEKGAGEHGERDEGQS